MKIIIFLCSSHQCYIGDDYTSYSELKLQNIKIKMSIGKKNEYHSDMRTSGFLFFGGSENLCLEGG